MSGNIRDTKVSTIKQQIDDLLIDAQTVLDNGERLEDWVDTFRARYKHLAKTSPTLFCFVTKYYGTPRFDREFFTKTLNIQLQAVSDVQESKITQNNAAENVGQYLASAFIPQLKNAK